MDRPLIARFTPEAWVNDNAIEVDPEGEQEWDATEAFTKLDTEYQTDLADLIALYDDVVETDDVLKSDPNAPEWVRNWQGPFTIRLRYADPPAVGDIASRIRSVLLDLAERIENPRPEDEASGDPDAESGYNDVAAATARILEIVSLGDIPAS